MSKSIVAIKPKGYNTICWEVSDICPFKCWYCPENTWGGNTKTPFTWDQCSDFLDMLVERTPACSFVITGGEPTDWPLFPKLLNKIYVPDSVFRDDFGWYIYVQSNMSKSKEFIDEWIDNTHYVIASYHPNVINTSKKRNKWFEKVLSFKYRTHLQLRILMDPRHWDHCLEIFHNLNDDSIILEPLIILNYHEGKDNPIPGAVGEEITSDFTKEYTPEQIEILNELKIKIGNTVYKTSPTPGYRLNGVMLKINNGETRILKDQSPAHVYQQLVSKKLNRFKGWHCEIGFKDLFVRPTGDIAGSICMSYKGSYIGNITNIDQIKWPTKATICPYKWCLCQSDVMIPKYKVTEEHAA